MTESLRLLQDNPRVHPYVVKNNFGTSLSISKAANLRDRDILNLLTTNPSISFEILKTSKSRDKTPAVYKRYQQYYKDVKVDEEFWFLERLPREEEPTLMLTS
jgi:hypothetical protein